PGATVTTGVDPRRSSLARCGNYTAALALALSGLPATCLSPAVLRVLSQFRPDQLVVREDYNLFLGDLSQYAAANRAAGPALALASGVELRGHWSPLEAANVDQALKELSQRSPRAFRRIVGVDIRTAVGFEEGTDINFAGLTEMGGNLALARSTARDAERCRRMVFHESGHELDAALGHSGRDFSSTPGSPFGKTRDPLDFVSVYASTHPCEDFAETHAHVLLNWEPLLAFPDVMLHARGPRGQKLACMLEHGCGVPVPPPSEGLQRVLADVRDGRSPFGFVAPDGRVVAAERHFRATLEAMLAQWNPAVPPPDTLLSEDRELRGWILNRIGFQVTAGEGDQLSVSEVARRVRKLVRLEAAATEQHRAVLGALQPGADPDLQTLADSLAGIRVRAALRALDEDRWGISPRTRNALADVLEECLPASHREAMREHLSRPDKGAIGACLERFARHPELSGPTGHPGTSLVREYEQIRRLVAAGGPELIAVLGPSLPDLEPLLRQCLFRGGVS
ncbi:MAG: putative zinc-binding metallopeptidase, partial [Candidatus Eremiobacterota bacterium]